MSFLQSFDNVGNEVMIWRVRLFAEQYLLCICPAETTYTISSSLSVSEAI